MKKFIQSLFKISKNPEFKIKTKGLRFSSSSIYKRKWYNKDVDSKLENG